MGLFKRGKQVATFQHPPVPLKLSAVPFPTMGIGGGLGFNGGSDLRMYLPGSINNWAREAGPLWKSSIVAAAVNLIARTFPEAPPRLYKPAKDGEREPLDTHDLLDLLDTPNAYYGGDALMGSTILSRCVSGNAYWLKRRDNAGRVRELYYVPHTAMAPTWPMDGSEFISGYSYRVNGKYYPVPIEDVVHFRTNILDPENPRIGLSELLAQARSIVGDNEADTWMASLLKNSAVPGMIIRPAAAATASWTQEFIDRLKESIKHKFSGDRRGEPMALSGPVDVDMVSFSPDNMALDVTRQIFECRVCAAMGVPVELLGLKAGRDGSTYSNKAQAAEDFYDRCIVPMKTTMGREIEKQLGIDFNITGLEFGWDYSHVECKQEDRDKKASRVAILVNAGILSQNEARSAVGYKPLPDPAMDKPEKKQAPAFGQSSDGGSNGAALARRQDMFTRILNQTRALVETSNGKH